jgi:hypothetical protein
MKTRVAFFMTVVVVVMTAVPGARQLVKADVPSIQCENAITGARDYFSQDLVLVDAATGLYRATNGGWQKISVPTGSAVEVGSGGSLYVYDKSSSEIHRSLDGSATWSLTGIFTYTEDSASDHLFASPVTNTIFMGVRYPVFPPGISAQYTGTYKSTDGGLTWREVITGSGAGAMAFSPDFAHDGIAFVDIYSVWKTTDWGETWTPTGSTNLSANAPLKSNHQPDSPSFPFIQPLLVISPQFSQDQTLFQIGTAVIKSIDGGASWSFVSDSPGYYPASAAISPNYIHDQTILFADSSGPNNLFISHDGGQSWHSLNFPNTPNNTGVRLIGPYQPWPAPPVMVPTGTYQIYLPMVVNLDSHGLELWATGYDSNHIYHLMRSGDDGNTWEEVCVFEATHWSYMSVVCR